MTNQALFELKQKYLFERLEFFLEPNRVRIFVKDLNGETEKYIPYEAITPDTRIITRQDGRVYAAAISFGIFAIVGFVLYFVGISSLMRWAPLWAVASIIFFGFHFYKRRRYFILDLNNNTSIFFLENKPSKEELHEFIKSLYATRRNYLRGKYFILNSAADPDSEIGRFKFMLEQEIISDSEFQEMKTTINNLRDVDKFQIKGLVN